MHVVQCLVVVSALFACCAAIDIKAHVNVDKLNSIFAKHVSSSRKTEYMFHRLLAETSGQGNELSQRRRLAQLGSDLCVWDAADSTCGISNSATIDFLDRADNDVAAYYSRDIGCLLQTDVDSCEDRACNWISGSGCAIPHEEFRNLHAARCLQEVDHIIDVRAGNLECRPKATELSCTASERCVWTGVSCSFDEWKYFHGIQSDGSYPQGFFDVLNDRSDKLLADVRTAIDNEDILEVSDLLDWTPPAFDCPDDVKQVVCDYVEAFLPFLITRIYCPMEYSEVFEIPDCDRDPICVAGTSADSFCQENDVPTVVSIQQGDIVFANSIEDPESRAYMFQNAQCGAINLPADCDNEEHCVWLDASSSCTVTEKWLSDEIGRLVKNTDDPVCAFFALDSLSGCVDEDDPETCIEDPMCSYSDSLESCIVGILGEIRYALDVSGLLDDYIRAEAACMAADNESQCNSVELPPEQFQDVDPSPELSTSPLEPPSPPGSEVVMESSETELDELAPLYYAEDHMADEPTSSPPQTSQTNQTPPESSPSTGVGALFDRFFGK